ncbi:uncharacterized protein C11orf24 [Melanotaenia boesemani]|uniref:uncharacterized protein C11orf24 n=1 Tax=Melanotaenia boesemani TaxID=1250792 RepID=UPI001C04C225|nr:uncharacterized protein C11orf24 [Melanotaenia boesemani]XP_041852318.1 uncharacterized protein C11orf24 [Melanotaenia boesemani]
MSPCPWKLQLSPAVLLFLLLFFANSSLTLLAEPEFHLLKQLNTTQETICSTGCNNDTLTNNPNLEDSLRNVSSVGEKNPSSVSDFNTSLTGTVVQTSVDRGSEGDDEVNPNRTEQVQFSHNSSSPINLTTVNSSLLFTVTTVAPSKQSTAGPMLPSNQQSAPPKPQSPSEPDPGTAAAPTFTAPPIISLVPPTTVLPSTPSMTPTLSPPSMLPSAKRTTTGPAAMITENKTTLSSPLRTTTVMVRNTSVTMVTASKAAVTSNATYATVAPAPKVSVVEVAGSALTQQLVDTAALLAVLVFGLLFFFVTVVVFIMQAYESYRTKDYTQVDYLINGMYTDSGV